MCLITYIADGIQRWILDTEWKLLEASKRADKYGLSQSDFYQLFAYGQKYLGDAYEYLMRHFATEAGKSNGQFCTPAEVSRVMAQVIGLDKATSATQTIYDPTCGSGSLLLKAHDLAKSRTGHDLTIYGQEMDTKPTSPGILGSGYMWASIADMQTKVLSETAE